MHAALVALSRWGHGRRPIIRGATRRAKWRSSCSSPGVEGEEGGKVQGEEDDERVGCARQEGPRRLVSRAVALSEVTSVLWAFHIR